MADNKKSFILYTDLIHTVDKMPNEKAGELFKHILEYVNDKNPVTEDLIINLTFEPIKQQLKRDLKRWENICERNKINGSKGGRPKNPKEPKKPRGLSGNPKEPKKPDNDNDNDNDNDIKYIFFDFWEKYHEITGLSKTDKEAAKSKWNKLTNSEKEKALMNIEKYSNSVKDKRYCKKARTYLQDKNFNDEFENNDKKSFSGLSQSEMLKRLYAGG